MKQWYSVRPHRTVGQMSANITKLTSALAAEEPGHSVANMESGQPAEASVRAKPRLIGLDLLRLAAVMLVLGRHVGTPPETWSTFQAWCRGGWIGVDLFFVLSGFLVSGLLFSEYKSRGHLSIGRFYMRRGWKIYPPFYALIAATVVLRTAVDWPFTWQSLLSEMVFTQSYVHGLWNHTWSLAVEEHFYLILPLVLVLVLRLNRGSATPLKPVLALAGCVAVAALVMRLANWYYRPAYSNLSHLFSSHLRLDSLFFGVAIAYAISFPHEQIPRVALPLEEVSDRRRRPLAYSGFRLYCRNDTVYLHLRANGLLLRERHAAGGSTHERRPQRSSRSPYGDTRRLVLLDLPLAHARDAMGRSAARKSSWRAIRVRAQSRSLSRRLVRSWCCHGQNSRVSRVAAKRSLVSFAFAGSIRRSCAEFREKAERMKSLNVRATQRARCVHERHVGCSVVCHWATKAAPRPWPRRFRPWGSRFGPSLWRCCLPSTL